MTTTTYWNRAYFYVLIPLNNLDYAQGIPWLEWLNYKDKMCSKFVDNKKIFILVAVLLF